LGRIVICCDVGGGRSYDIGMSELPNDDSDSAETSWDANDPRRQHDQMAPPAEPCECYCLHCGRVFMSDQMWLQRIIGGRDGFDGFWMCPTANCDGAGFTFDIFPTDPDHPANAGWYDDDEVEYDEESEDEFAEEFHDVPASEWDPDESQYEGDDDIEGEEWKFGLPPGAEAPAEKWSAGRKEWEEEQKKYDEPDTRPREVDWTNRDTPGNFSDDDIPF
jgi:hypothetical protein